ncbi:MAG: hypothetical protein EXR72_03965 [Myxococcales bacterium]|nr:hypothetical protein [Myxococcales bacterium]
MQRKCWLLLLIVLSCAARSAGAAGADGTIVQLEGDVAYFDIGETRGLRVGSTVRVLRTITAKHPVTGEALIDHFPLGTLGVIEVGKVLSYGRVDKGIVGTVKVGDVVRLGPPPAPHLPTPSVTGPGASAALDAVEVWLSTLGKPLGERVRLLGLFCARHPDSPYVPGLRREMVVFRDLEERLTVAARPRVEEPYEAMAPQGPAPVTIQGALPPRLYAGDPLEVAILVREVARVQAAFV